MAILEVCADSIGSVAAARQGGAARVELCSGLAEGGLTPSVGLIRAAVRTGIPVNVLIRPREGDFVYSEAEIDCMVDDIRTSVAEGANGIVIGALTPEGDIDTHVCRRLIAAAGSVEVTFHRAFDLCRDPSAALEDIIALGCHRLLTSGLARSAADGIDMIASLRRRSAGRLSVMAGCGVSPANARRIVLETGISEIHASARHAIPSKMRYRNSDVKMGAPGADEYCRMATSAETVSKIIKEIQDI